MSTFRVTTRILLNSFLKVGTSVKIYGKNLLKIMGSSDVARSRGYLGIGLGFLAEAVHLGKIWI